MEVTEIYLSLGSNLGNRIDYIDSAIKKIAKTIGEVLTSSSMFETPPLGFEADTPFINCVISVQTTYEPSKVLLLTQAIEQELGRKKKSDIGYQSRVIDIDIIMFGNTIIDTPLLHLPHKEYRNRKFVLVPFTEIAKNLIDPFTHLTNSQLLENCSDTSEIQSIQ